MSSKKILFVATVDGHIKSFHIPYLKWFKDNGYETHVASNGDCDLEFVDKKWQVEFERSPFKLRQFTAYRQLKDILQQHDFELITCHTPMAGVLTRLAAIGARRSGTKLLYTAHGFHFFKGASLLNWLLYFPVEVALTNFTDAVITINEEDFVRIKKFGAKSCTYFKIPGIGVNADRFFPVNSSVKENLRREVEMPLDKCIMIYAAELSNRKNQKFIIEAIYQNKHEFSDTVVLFAGRGEDEGKLKKLVKDYSLDDIIFFLGFRTDIAKLFQLSDIGISSSKQEGLPINTLEEMFTGLPVVVSNERGHRELITDGINGYLFCKEDYTDFVAKICELKNNPALCLSIGKQAIMTANRFEIKVCLTSMSSIFRKYLV